MADNAKLEAVLTWLAEKQAENIRVYDVGKNSAYTDFIVVCEGTADLHNKAIANHVLDMAKEHKLLVLSKAGLEFGVWVLLDISDVVIHIFLPEKREYYKIDEFFSELAGLSDKEKPHDQAPTA
ncbi:MAG TPA: ribosome silencing factor [Candidatus Syntrophosphaera sp.]|nr:ribosome silencing factor [Candidatus Cloacimonadota bacterium]HOH47840.1 ribosome silencing factor [Candidatus Syntrophosphaera sp.]HOR03648.1 ribosome silencing factor [Candidatus Syntrophosphaera sp.]HPB43458.1 ribosome silencing factor [Candidatus Syntrophosphaera sp.]HPK83465.1 ribosome silencing factor [Candidatus Syntrophosphaera sp.]